MSSAVPTSVANGHSHSWIPWLPEGPSWHPLLLLPGADGKAAASLAGHAERQASASADSKSDPHKEAINRTKDKPWAPKRAPSHPTPCIERKATTLLCGHSLWSRHSAKDATDRSSLGLSRVSIITCILILWIFIFISLPGMLFYQSSPRFCLNFALSRKISLTPK